MHVIYLNVDLSFSLSLSLSLSLTHSLVVLGANGGGVRHVQRDDVCNDRRRRVCLLDKPFRSQGIPRQTSLR